MTRAPFQPLGTEARWKTVYRALRATPVGATLAYERMAEELYLHPAKDRAKLHAAVHRAARELLEVDLRAVEVAPNVGYRVVDAPEHLRLGRQHQRRARRELAKGQATVTYVDLSGVTPEIRNAFLVVGQAFSMQCDMMRRLDVRQGRLEETVSSAVEKQDRSAGELDAMRERIERLESRLT